MQSPHGIETGNAAPAKKILNFLLQEVSISPTRWKSK
jgi:hypothetical protein